MAICCHSSHLCFSYGHSSLESRGLNSLDKWLHIHTNKISESGCTVLCFQETKKEDIDLPFIRKFCLARFDSFAFLPSIGRSGGILTVWCSAHFKGDNVFQNEYVVFVVLQSVKCGSCWTLTHIYAPCQDDIKPEFQSWLNGVSVPEAIDGLIVGDFNFPRSFSRTETHQVDI